MSSNTTENLPRRKSITLSLTITRCIGSAAIVVSVLVLLGWILDVAVLKSVIPGANNMKVNSALGFLFSGLSLLLYTVPSEYIQKKAIYARIGSFFAALTVLIGLLTLCEHVFNHNYGIDELLIRGETDWHTHSPGRMSWLTAINFSLLGFVLFLGNSQNTIKQRVIQYAALFVLAIASLALLGYLYHSGALYKISFMSSMAMHTALLFWLLAIAVLLSHPRLSSESWRYGLAAIVVILEFGLRLKLTAWLGSGFPPFLLFFPGIIFVALLTGFGPGLFTTALSAMVVTVWIFEPVGLLYIESAVNQVSLALFCGIGGMICAVIRLYYRNQKKAADFDRALAIQESRRETEFLGAILDSSSQPFAVGYRDGRLGRTNHAFEELTGYSKAELLQLDSIKILTPPEWRAYEDEMLAGLIVTGEPIRYEKEYIRKDGSRVSVELLAHLVRDEQGQPDYYYAFITDTTERKQAEKALRLSEERYRSLFDNSLDAIFSLASNGCFVTANTAALRLAGKTLPEMQSMHFLDLCAPDQREQAANAFKAALCRQCLTVETALIDTHGIRREIFISGAPTIVDGEVVGVSCIARDMTIRKQTEKALRESEEAFRAMFEISSVGKVITDPVSGRFLRVNKAYCELTGYTEAELLQRTFMEITDPRDREDDVELKDQFIQGISTVFEREKRYVRPDGSLVWAHVTLNLIRNEAGEPIRMVGVMQNISERKRIETALREREHRLNAIIEYSPSALSLKHPDGRYALANPNLQRIHHLSEAQIIGKTDFDLYPEATARVFQANDRQVLETMAHQSIEEIIPVAGVPRVYMTHMFPVQDDAGQAEYICRISLDITERKQAQEALELLNVELEDRVKMRTDELTDLNQSLESFVYSVSHDLKTPLRGIEGYSRLLQQDYGAILDGEGNLFLRNIREGVNRMNDLIDDLLAYSRMSRRKLDADQVDVKLLLENIVQERKEEITKRGVIIENNLTPLTLCADEEGLALVLRNLVQNALKFTQHTSAPHIEIGAKQDENTVTLWVKDNGIGFDMKYVDRIFEIFQRLHRLEDYPGTGIGLSLVKTAMQRMNGKVWAQSEPGQGASFFLGFKKVV
jgi:PAS domain S-box-containing protein